MRLFDAHCDTIIKVVDDGVDFLSASAASQVSLPGFRQAGIRAQLFACFVLSERFPGAERERAETLVRGVHDVVAASRGALRLVASRADLPGEGAGPIAAIIGLEGADPLEGRAEALVDFHRMGVRLIIPAWKDNAFAGTAFGTDTPLTSEGCRLVQLAQELGVVVDVSHLSDRSFADVLHSTRLPCIASHSNCRALCPSRRNLTDAQIRALADRGGVIGVNFFSGFLDPAFYRAMEDVRSRAADGASERRFIGWVESAARPAAVWIARHVQHAISVGGEDCVGLGSDLDGVSSLPLGIDSVGDLSRVPQLLESAGLMARQVEKVCWDNQRRVFSETLSPN